MNLLPLDAAGGRLVIAGTTGPVLAPVLPERVVGGIRPESFYAARAGGFDPILSLGVEHSEYLGADTVLTGVVPPTSHRVQARLPGRHLALPGEVVSLGFSADGLHLFDAESGARLERVPVLA